MHFLCKFPLVEVDLVVLSLCDNYKSSFHVGPSLVADVFTWWIATVQPLSLLWTIVNGYFSKSVNPWLRWKSLIMDTQWNSEISNRRRRLPTSLTSAPHRPLSILWWLSRNCTHIRGQVKSTVHSHIRVHQVYYLILLPVITCRCTTWYSSHYTTL